ncbi:hypothetical protein CKO28_12945 [Rhodovibrio sodomensis]|uniref:Squalene cyclase C-terminal domain-containing protein n=1 Tax=Rhodovibrio sodomensis TaxID=1088 RepID=A0ABS1DFD0_9PROT|nr:hypothetical protein [Rhodovibrio sodomensis]MBK1668938.1 hypothetical protein [Rhodovibrio sodomensis]
MARHYSLIDGWSASYPETTGYIVPTLLAVSGRLGEPEHKERARRMLDWLVGIQLADGGFQGGRIDAQPVVSVTFNTGQILIGLAAGVQTFGDVYADAMHAAASFLRDSQDCDGCWRSHPSPFAAPGDKAYETHAALGLFAAETAAPGYGYAEAGLREVDWALGRQRANGWITDCCLNDPERPLTHTLGYFLRGVIGAYDASGDRVYLEGARRTADALVAAQRTDGALAGRLTHDWHPAVEWVCLTGVAQVAECWLLLAERTRDNGYVAAAQAANRFVRRTVDLDGPDDRRGGVKGSFPVDGDYGPYEYLNWAAKFAIDANLAELRLS